MRRVIYGAAALLWLVFAVAIFSFPDADPRTAVDSINAWGLARQFAAGTFEYPSGDDESIPIAPKDGQHILNYPPLLIQLIMPVAVAVDRETFADLWTAASLAALVTSCAMLVPALRPSQRPWLWLLTPLFIPFLDAFQVGQITIVLLLLLTLAWRSAERRQAWVVGLCIALAAWFKVYPGLFLIYFLWRREWRFAAWTCIWGTALLVFQVAVSGLDTMLDFFPVLALFTRATFGQNMGDSMSIFAFAQHLWGDGSTIAPIVNSALLFSLTRVGLLALLMVVMFWLTRRTNNTALHFALVNFTMLMFSTWLWGSSVPPIFLSMVLAVRGATRVQQLLVLIAGLLVTTKTIVNFPGPALDAYWWTLNAGFGGLMLLWSVIVSRLWRAAETAPLPQAAPATVQAR